MLTAEQIEARKSHIGASDMAAIMGLSPWRSPWDVWADKTGKLDGQANENDSMHAGNRFEAGVLDEAEARLGPLRRNIVVPGPGPLASTLDGQLIADDVPVEAKFIGAFGQVSADWGEEGTDEIPDIYLIQTHVQMICTGKPIAHLVAFLCGQGFKHYPVERNSDLAAAIVETAADWWQRHVVADVPPTDSKPSEEIVKRIRREPGSVVTIDMGVVEEWQAAREERLAAEKREKEAKRAVEAALGTAEAGQLEDGRMVTYLEQSRAGFDKDRLKAEQPDIYAKYQATSRFRVMRLKKSK